MITDGRVIEFALDTITDIDIEMHTRMIAVASLISSIGQRHFVISATAVKNKA